MEKKIENIINKFFDKMSFKLDALELKKEKDNIFLITIKVSDIKDSSLLIGPSGKNLVSIKNLLRLIIIKNIEQNIRLHLEINDYIKSKDRKLIQLVIKKIQLANNLQKDIAMPLLSSYERKKVHSHVSENEDENIYTESRGEGKERKIFICCKEKTINPVKRKLSIDIDGNDI